MKHQLQSAIMVLCIMAFGLGAFAQAQDTLPYREITDYPNNYSAVDMASRMVDALGFRFYWATEGLRNTDLAFRPTESARSVEETIDHILSMSYMLMNSVRQIDDKPEEGLSFKEERAMVLHNLKTTSELLQKSNSEDLKSYTIKLKNGETLPFWNFVNGPIADCIWHCGQIASFRRLSGNPFNSKVSLFRGKVMD